MTNARRERFADRIRCHDPREIEPLLDWCERNVRRRPGHVVAVGLAYVHGLNEQQIVAATLDDREAPVRIGFPDARRQTAIVTAARLPLTLDEPDWLAEAAVGLAAEAQELGPGDLLYRVRRRTNIPLRASYIRRLVSEAAYEACGTRISCLTLNHSRVAALREAGLPLALFGSGHAHAWAARLAAAELDLLLPRRTR